MALLIVEVFEVMINSFVSLLPAVRHWHMGLDIEADFLFTYLSVWKMHTLCHTAVNVLTPRIERAVFWMLQILHLLPIYFIFMYLSGSLRALWNVHRICARVVHIIIFILVVHCATDYHSWSYGARFLSLGLGATTRSGLIEVQHILWTVRSWTWFIAATARTFQAHYKLLDWSYASKWFN